ncbi:hypothetical protein [Granulosicoccus antarcticus]|uniref:CBS domain-containing protein n=1 Tax=Granulosicoccus antarcticus IMCC3135 TaxID=1192854 RepID=A0A2Z2NTN1_9GAMM|nr:hypothetical protein [Granulosicoccus antarcticus]ASJ72110.1 hypothetical protein IMCC3135_10080 [Granulosicoccus antarcticus IMCC3135]
MGYELWTSPVTGIRRRGSKLVELRRHFEDAITVEAIYEPIQACEVDMPTKALSEILEKRGFDICGVRYPGSDEIHNYVTAESLTSATHVSDCIQIIASNTVISETTAIADCLHFLADMQWKFVLVGTSIAGIVTQWDLNKPPSRVYFFGILSLFEQHLNLWIRRYYTDEEMRAVVGTNKHRSAETLQQRKKLRGIPTALIENFNIPEKRLLLFSNEYLLAALNIDAEDEIKIENIATFRNALMHSANSVLDSLTWQEVATMILFIEKTLELSDKLIEDDALRTKEPDSEHLFASA